MRTIRTKIYEFKELSEKAKQNAIDWYRNNNLDHDFVYDDMYKTVKEFNSLFGIKEDSRSWLDFSTSHIDDNILELKGIRLQKYIWNNYGYKLFKRKYYGSIGDNKIINHPCIKTNYYNIEKGARVSSSNFYYSRIQKTKECVLTGMCYDDNILEPIYNFLESGHKEDSFSYLTFEMLIKDCFDEAQKTIENEIEYREGDQFIIEEIEANNYEFTKDGNIF